jgi:hypothetical protein
MPSRRFGFELSTFATCYSPFLRKIFSNEHDFLPLYLGYFDDNSLNSFLRCFAGYIWPTKTKLETESIERSPFLQPDHSFQHDLTV